MPRTLHMILIHGADVIAKMILPIATLSEEAQESLNKEFRNLRKFHTRKTSRLNSNEDLIHMLLVSSDPCLNEFRKKPKVNKSKPFTQEMLDLIVENVEDDEEE